MPEQAFAEYEKARSEEGKSLHRVRIICFITITHTIRTEQEQKKRVRKCPLTVSRQHADVLILS